MKNSPDGPTRSPLSEMVPPEIMKEEGLSVTDAKLAEAIPDLIRAGPSWDPTR